MAQQTVLVPLVPIQGRPRRNGCVLPGVACRRHARLGPVNNSCSMKCLVRSHPLFRQIGNDDFELILEKARHLELPSHETLFRQGDEAQRFYLVIDGAIKLFRIFDSGMESVVGNATALQAVGEYDVFTRGGRYDCFAETTRPTRLIGFSAPLYLQLARKNNTTALALVEYLAEKRSSHYSEIETITICNARQRVISYLKKLCEDNDNRLMGISGNQGLVLPVPKYQIAAYLGMKPETFSRVLAALQKDGVIQINRREIVITDPDLLDAGQD
ncbi:Crp/Fnr family transcriptional regulator [Marinospirillum alkaliphilum]|uniref:cAMP-binding domain of CRP or a regulatory subunit of cAMP-dependent protein kinases n=1 Tax=Marinospirillum alkaliphilum DSM 21637 TaxID=1122209 RepID=A0A1K1ZLT3_9GAMM|nr:Crp/Fnr family transcriptional regulator [Marinospirillum alkaliphilum]SFX75079.1 cAMP-binding domain of CRP or a regulatory subunit of cAMP-dependent protein kinases [Marinospirillum alkaliphilum DSM 21637]